MRHTPRWERWSPDIKGYSLYRRALDCERHDEEGSALAGYNEALRYEPGSFLITIRRAALLEGRGEFKDACDAYRTCNELWPEHIETAYRLAASYANATNDRDLSASEIVLKGIEDRLKLRKLWGEWGRTWLLTRWNAGERFYWSSWFRQHPPLVGSSNRKHLLVAVEVAKQVRGIGRIVFPNQSANVSIDDLITRMANLTTRRNSVVNRISKPITGRNLSSPYIYLFHPERLKPEKTTAEQHADRRQPQHDCDWHDEENDEGLVILPLALSRIKWRLRPRKRIGWLAHYNAACFYSLALKLDELDESLLPFGFTIKEWCMDCTRAAVRELGHVRRDPLNKLEPDWYRRDPELEPLRKRLKGTRWAELVGL